VSLGRPSVSRHSLVAFALSTARELGGIEPGRCDASLMYGAAGIATFLAEVARLLDKRSVLAQAMRWLHAAHAFARTRGYVRQPDGGKASHPRHVNGLFLGVGGLAWADAIVADACGDLAGRERAIVALRNALSVTPANGDLIRGRAAFAEAARELLGTLAAISHTEDRLLAELVAEGDRCALAHARGDLQSVPLLTVAHGLAGMLLVLLRSPRHRAFALDRVDELSELEKRERGLWVYPLTVGKVSGASIGSWCNGVPGILHLYLRAAATATHSARLERALVHAAITTARLRADMPSLCCGGAGRALLLHDAAATTGSAVLRQRGRALLASAIRRSSVSAPALFSGRTGVAWVALAIAEPAVRRPLLFASSSPTSAVAGSA
jgi:eukaryotic-like serine/threonine-protein kinase